ncbi:hypothetical protein EMG21_28300 [Klebsiella pneumoniae]|nr:hypothetical protein EMG21_28300 [Klebsiella pneumoniae]
MTTEDIGLNHLEGDSRTAIKEIASWEHTQFLARCLGRADLIGTVAANSISGLHTVFEHLNALSGIRVVESWICLSRIKERYDL